MNVILSLLVLPKLLFLISVLPQPADLKKKAIVSKLSSEKIWIATFSYLFCSIFPAQNGILWIVR